MPPVRAIHPRRSAAPWILPAALAWLLTPSIAHAAAHDRAKEFTPGCVPAILPVQPVGPSASREVVDGSGGRLRLTLWRQPCSGGDGQALLTLTPLAGQPRVGTVQVVQAGRLARFPDLLASAQPLSFLFGPVDAPTSALLNVSLDPPFDDDCAFELRYTAPGTAVALPLALPAEPGAACTLAFDAGGAVLSQRLGGTWFDAAREGEGVMADFFVVDGERVAFLAWYTYENGQQRYLVGNATYAEGERRIRLPLVETGGGQFGAAFRAEQVTRRAWGEALLSFPDCANLVLAWRRADGQSGELRLRRAGAADGLACP